MNLQFYLLGLKKSTEVLPDEDLHFKNKFYHACV